MKLEFKSNVLQVIGTCEISEFPTFTQLLNAVVAGQEIICKSDLIVKDRSELCVFMFYNKNNINGPHFSFTGTVEFVGPYPEYDYPFAYKFYPKKLVDSGSICLDDITFEPIEEIIKSKKL
jgi:hypothetical protein